MLSRTFSVLTIGSIFVSIGELRRSFFGEILKIFFLFIYIFRSCEEIVEGRGYFFQQKLSVCCYATANVNTFKLVSPLFVAG